MITLDSDDEFVDGNPSKCQPNPIAKEKSNVDVPVVNADVEFEKILEDLAGHSVKEKERDERNGGKRCEYPENRKNIEKERKMAEKEAKKREAEEKKIQKLREKEV